MSEEGSASDEGSPSKPEGFRVQHYRRDGVVVVVVTGEVDALTATQLTTEIDAATAEPAEAVIVDLSEVEFLASAGLGALMTAHEKVAPKARYGVVADGPATRRPITLLGLDNMFTLHRTLDEALGSQDT